MARRVSTLDLWRNQVYSKTNIKLLKNRTVLDVGCGQGIVSVYLEKNNKSVVGIDIVSFDTWRVFSNKHLRFLKGNAEKMPFKSNSFNGVFLQDVLHHVKDPSKVLKEINRVTKKKSVLLLVEGNRFNPLLYIHMTKMNGHEHLTFSNFKKLISKEFPNVTFGQFESHYIPYLSVPLYLLFESLIEAIFNYTPILNRFKSYNYAIIRK